MFVYAKESGMRQGPDGQNVFYTEGETWEAGSAFVQANKSLFASRPNTVRGADDAAPKVERATRRPGETR